MKEGYFNLPNFLTMLRFLFSPVFFILFIVRKEKLALIIFILVAITDIFDGWVARTTNQKTAFGKFLDPMADKFMIFLAITALALRYGLPLWAVPLILSRDIVSLCGSVLVYFKKRGPWTASKLGKITTLLQVIVICSYIIDFYKTIFLWATIAFSLATAISYAWRGKRIIKEEI